MALEWYLDKCPNDECERMLYIIAEVGSPVRNYCAGCGCSFTALRRADADSEAEDE